MASASELHCPRCKAPLEPLEFEGQEVDLCERCGGLWCEPEDWDTEQLGPAADAPEPRGDGEREVEIVVEPGNFTLVKTEQLRSDDWACPECRQPLSLLKVREVQGLMLDRCAACGGVWFDNREWEHLAALRSWQEQRPGIERKATWGEWLFQVLLRLPIEFNIAPRRQPLITYLIIAICVLLELFVPTEAKLAYAVQGADSLRPGGWLTLITHQFLHMGWLHLAGNAYLLYILGDNVEDVLGRLGFLAFYLVCGALAAAFYVLFTWLPDVPVVGASGAISGVIAAYFVLFRRSRLTFMFIIFQFKLPAAVWIGVWLGIQVAASLLDPNMVLGVAWLIHVGGFLAGLLFILPIRRRLIESYPLLHLLDTRRIRVGQSRTPSAS